MVTPLVRVIGICLTAVLLCKVLERYAKEQAVLLILGVSAGVLAAACLLLQPALEQIGALFLTAGLDESYARVICKALGICYLTQLGSDVCRDCREEALSTVVLLTGKISILLLALPMLELLLRTVEGVLA